MSNRPASIDDLGPNAGLVDEMYRLYRENPEAVSPGWRDFFADYQPRGEVPAPETQAALAHEPEASAREAGIPPSSEPGPERPLRADKPGLQAPMALEGQAAEPLRGA